MLFRSSPSRLIACARITAPRKTTPTTAKVRVVDISAPPSLAKVSSPMPKPRITTAATPTAAASVGVPPELMGIGPVPAIRAVCEKAGIRVSDVDRVEINEAFGAQIMACARELGLDEEKLDVNGGAIAIGHPLGATGVRLTLTVARELKRRGLRWGIASACIGGGQGIAMLVENPAVA